MNNAAAQKAGEKRIETSMPLGVKIMRESDLIKKHWIHTDALTSFVF